MRTPTSSRLRYSQAVPVHDKSKGRASKTAALKRPGVDSTTYTLRDTTLIVAVGIGFCLVLLRRQILPERFLGDETTIQQLAQQLWETPDDQSYDRVADIYRLFGLADAPLAAGLIGFILSLLPYILSIRMHSWRHAFAPIAIMAGGILLSAIYLGSYSKELFVVPIVLLVMLLPERRRSLFIIAAGMALYAALFREYWYLSAIVFLILCAAKSVFRSPVILFVTCLAGVFVGSLVFSYAMQVPADFYRVSVNLYRESSGDANSLIARYVHFPEPFGGALNNVLSFAYLQFPFPLALKASPYYISLFLIFTLLWASFYFVTRRSAVQDLGLRGRALVHRISAFVLSFAVAQAFFEPDYGSALKHLTPLLALFLVPWLVAKTETSETTMSERRLRRGE